MEKERYNVIQVTDEFLERDEFLPYVANGFVGSFMLARNCPLTGTWEVPRYSLLEALGQNALRTGSDGAVHWFERYMADYPERTNFIFFQPEVADWLSCLGDARLHSIQGQR